MSARIPKSALYPCGRMGSWRIISIPGAGMRIICMDLGGAIGAVRFIRDCFSFILFYMMSIYQKGPSRSIPNWAREDEFIFHIYSCACARH